MKKNVFKKAFFVLWGLALSCFGANAQTQMPLID